MSLNTARYIVHDSPEPSSSNALKSFWAHNLCPGKRLSATIYESFKTVARRRTCRRGIQFLGDYSGNDLWEQKKKKNNRA